MSNPKKPRTPRGKGNPKPKGEPKARRARKPKQGKALVPIYLPAVAPGTGGGSGGAKRGRKPKLELNDNTLATIRALGQIHCTNEEAAACLLVACSTFKAFLKEHAEARDAFEDGRLNGKASLRRLQFAMAATKPVMGIWLGKQWLDQKDKLLHGNDPEAPFGPSITPAMTPKEAAEVYARDLAGGANGNA